MTKRILLTAFAVCMLFACAKDKPGSGEDPKPNPDPNEEIVPTMKRGFMVPRLEHISQLTINDAADWGANIVRLQVCPVLYAESRNLEMWAAMPDYLNLLDERIKWAKAKNMKVVVDLHEAPVPNHGDVNQPAFWNKPETKPNFIRFWKELATRFKSPAYNDIIYGYDIYNEPAEKVPNTAHIPYKWRAMAPEIIAAIRAIDSDVWIIYEPGPWNGPDNYVGLEPLADKKVIYSIHFYLPGKFTHQGVTEPTRAEALKAIGVKYPGVIRNVEWNKAKLISELKPIDDFQRKYKVPVFVGEFSVIRWAPVPSAVQWLTDVLSLFEERKWAWCYHAFREWNGWDLEYPEGTEAFWYKGDPAPQRSKTETERAKVIKAAFRKNAK